MHARQQNSPNYMIEVIRDEYLIIRDMGPWDRHLTITNGAEAVVEELHHQLNGRKLYYYDTDGQIDQLLVANGRFAGFKSGGPSDYQPRT